MHYRKVYIIHVGDSSRFDIAWALLPTAIAFLLSQYEQPAQALFTNSFE